MEVWTSMIQRNLMIPGIQSSNGSEWTLIIQKSTVIPPSPMILFNIFKRILHKAIFGQWAIFIRLVLSKKLKHCLFVLHVIHTQPNIQKCLLHQIASASAVQSSRRAVCEQKYCSSRTFVLGVMKTAMNDIFMHDQQPVIAMITRSSL